MPSSVFCLFRHPSGIAVFSSFAIVACGGKYVEGTPDDRQVPLDQLVGGNFGAAAGGATAPIGGGPSQVQSGGAFAGSGGNSPGVGSAPSAVGGAPMGIGGAVSTGGSASSGGGDVGSGGLGSGGTPGFIEYASCEEPVDLGRPEFLQIEGTLRADGLDLYRGQCGGAGPEAAFLFHAPQTGIYDFDTRYSYGDAVLGVVAEDCYGAQLACNDDTYELDSAVTLSMTEGQTIALIVEHLSGEPGDFSLNISLSPSQETCGLDLGSDIGTLWSGDLSIPNTEEPREWECGGSDPAITFRWRAPESALFDFSTMGSNFDTVMILRTDCTSESITCNDDTQYAQGLTSQILYEMVEGQVVVIEISTFNGFPNVDFPYLNFSIERD